MKFPVPQEPIETKTDIKEADLDNNERNKRIIIKSPRLKSTKQIPMIEIQILKNDIKSS